MSKGIKINFNIFFVILFAIISLNACQKRISTTNGQILYDPNEDTYSYAGQTSGKQQYTQDKNSKTYQNQQQEIMNLYNKNQNVNPDSSKNINENYYHAGQTNGNINNKTSTKENNKQIQNIKNNSKQNDAGVVAPVVLNNQTDQKETSAINKFNQPKKSADGKYTYVSNAKMAGIKNKNNDNVITDRELNDKLYGSMDGKFKRSKLDQINKRDGVYGNKTSIIDEKIRVDGTETPNASNGNSSARKFGSSGSKGSSLGLQDIDDTSFSSPASIDGSLTSSAGSSVSGNATSAGLGAADKAALWTSIGTGGASLGVSGASLATSLIGKGTSSAVSETGSKAGGEALKDKATEPAKEPAKEQQKKDDKDKKKNKKLYIQVNRYNNAQWANKVFSKLRKSYPNASSRMEGTQTVLLVGPYPNKIAGRAVKAKLISEGFTGAFFTNK